MKHFTLKLFLLIACLCGATSVWAAEISATLVHTAAVQGGSNAAGKSLDAETHYYNNWGASGWAAQAFIGFSFTIPDGQAITSATLKFYSNCGGNRNGRTVDVYYKDGTDFDYENVNLVNWNGAGTWLAKPTDNLTVELKTIDVTSAVKAIAESNSKDILFTLGGAAAGAYLYGKGSKDKAPTLTILTSSAETQTTYTVRYTDGNIDLKDPVEYQGTIGEKATASNDDMNSFMADGKKWEYASGNKEITLASDANSNVITLTFSEVPQYNYSIKTSTGIVLASDIAYAGETVTTPYPQYILQGTSLVGAEVTNKEYNYKMTVNEEGQTGIVNYSATNINDVIYFSEAEKIEGATANNAGNANIRCSMSEGAYFPVDVVVTTLEPGKYKVSTQVWGNAGTTFTIAAGENNVLEAETKGYIQSYTSEEFAVSSTTDIIVKAGGSSGKLIDWIYIQRTGDVTISKSISEAGYATLYSDKALDFNNVEGLKAYIITAANGDKLTTQKVTKIPANTGVLLEGEAGTYDIPVAASDEPVEGNRFEGVLEATEKEAGIFVLMNSTAGVGFYKTSNTFTVGAGTAYLPADIVPAEVKALRINQEGTTAIQGIDSEVNEANAEIYNLAGQRVVAPTKGIYVINGKKVMVK